MRANDKSMVTVHNVASSLASSILTQPSGLTYGANWSTSVRPIVQVYGTSGTVRKSGSPSTYVSSPYK